jgi:hypothetical protein
MLAQEKYSTRNEGESTKFSAKSAGQVERFTNTSAMKPRTMRVFGAKSLRLAISCRLVFHVQRSGLTALYCCAIVTH